MSGGIDSRRPRRIVLAAALLYAVALAVAWGLGTAKAERRIGEMLESAETGYSAVVYGEIEAALRSAGGMIINLLGGTFVPQSAERMRELARTFNIDEINLVDRSGRVVSSNLDSVLGADFHASPETREFLALTNDEVTVVSQPFRHGAANPEMYCKYYGMPFPDHAGILQLGISLGRLRSNMYSYTEKEADAILRDWHFSVRGWYERVSDGPFEEGLRFRREGTADVGPTLGRYFSFEGYRYAALLPEDFCYSQRNQMFAVSALALAILFVFFTYALVRLAGASARVEALHAEAEARTAADLALARRIQMSALPSPTGAFLDALAFTFAAASEPAREVGGDFYDFYPLPGGRVAFLVADVSGKGIPAALFMMEAKNVLKACLIEFADMEEALAEANARLCAVNEAEMFVTAWVGALDVRNGVFEYVNAGHCRPFVRHADGRVEKVVGKGGLLLGLFPDAAYRAHRLGLGAGDLLYLYTDGVTEAMNARKRLFGEDRLTAALASDGEAGVARALAAFVGGAERSDDMTSLAVRWHGAPVRREATFPCREESFASALAFLREGLSGVPTKSVSRVLNAADEIVSNIVSYSGAPSFTLALSRGADRLRLVFSDAGRAYDPLSHVDPDAHAPLAERQIGGLGLMMVKRLVDRVTYAREGGENRLTLIKKIDVKVTGDGGGRPATDR